MIAAASASSAALIAAASAFVGLQDVSGGLLPGSVGEVLRRQAGSRGSGCWDMALLYHWGYWSQFDYRADESSWPLIPTTEPEALAEFARARGVLGAKPCDGDVFLQYSPRRSEFVRGGVIAHVYIDHDRPHDATYFEAVVLEGNSNRSGELGGPRVARLVRRLCPDLGDRFIRWTELR
ncbi:MAG: hypothetical protein JWM41_3404 [Gemmatimonadetes bacterium]|nr:hypothetical protein [Gemmatimonadota bacterium]